MLRHGQTASIVVQTGGVVPESISKTLDFRDDFRQRPVRTDKATPRCVLASCEENSSRSHCRLLLAGWIVDLREHWLINAFDTAVGGSGFEAGGESEAIGWQADFSAAGLIVDFEVKDSFIGQFVGVCFEHGVDNDFAVVNVQEVAGAGRRVFVVFGVFDACELNLLGAGEFEFSGDQVVGRGGIGIDVPVVGDSQLNGHRALAATREFIEQGINDSADGLILSLFVLQVLGR